MLSKNSEYLFIGALFTIIAIFVLFIYFNQQNSKDSFDDAMNQRKHIINGVIQYIDLHTQPPASICTNAPSNPDNYSPKLACVSKIASDAEKVATLTSDYIQSEFSAFDDALLKQDTLAKAIHDDRDSYINRGYVADYMEYIAANPPPISGTGELFTSINSSLIPTHLFPSNPGDFYGEYEATIGQYVLLNGIKLFLDSRNLDIIDVDGSPIITYQVSELMKVPYNKMPTTTLKLSFTSTVHKSADSSKQAKITLLQQLGIDGSNLFLYGNGGIYRMYNNYKNLIFKLERKTIL